MESAICLGNSVVLLFSFEPIAALFLLIPIVIVESLILAWCLKLPFKRVIGLCFIANLLSTICGVIIAPLEMLGYILAHTGSPIALLGGLLYLSLFGAGFIISYYVERWYYLKRWQPELPRKTISKACLLANIATYIPLLFLMFYLSDRYDSKQPHREKTRRISCASNLKQIGLGMKQYTIDYNDFFPAASNGESLELLRSQNYITDHRLYVCPSTGHYYDEHAANAPITNEKCSYLYFGAGMSEKDSPDSPIACDKPENHKNYGNVLFVGGYVQGFSGANWMENAGVPKRK